jgi:hypothetical protein
MFPNTTTTVVIDSAQCVVLDHRTYLVSLIDNPIFANPPLNPKFRGEILTGYQPGCLATRWLRITAEGGGQQSNCVYQVVWVK